MVKIGLSSPLQEHLFFVCVIDQDKSTQGFHLIKLSIIQIVSLQYNQVQQRMKSKVIFALCGIGVVFYTYLAGLAGLLLLVLIMIAMAVFLYFKQNIFLYMPIAPGQNRSPSMNPFGLKHPSQHDLKSTDLCLVTSDGVRIRGWHVFAPNTKRVLIYFHENAGNIGTRLYLVQNMVKTDTDVVLVAYRGYSDSDSVASQEGIMRDSIAIIQYALYYAESKKIPLYILGRSLGGAVAIYVAQLEKYKHKIRGIILENTFTSISEMIDDHLPYLKWLKFLQRNYWESINRIADVKADFLFIKCLKDQIVPCEQMDKLMKAATSPVRQFIIEDGSHNISWIIEPRKYFNKLNQFFQTLEK